VKPENVMVREDGVIKVLDFGIARRAGGGVDPQGATLTPALPTLTLEGVKLGTPLYMAPEQVRGDPLDGRADQFAWGVLAFEQLTGALPWRGAGDAFAVVASILTDTPDSAALDRAGVAPAVRDVVLRALSKRPADRFASMDEAARALEAAAKGEAPGKAAKGEAPGKAAKGEAPGEAAKGKEGAPSTEGAPVTSATAEQRFSTKEVEVVLARAIEQQAAKKDGRLGFDEVLAAAREVGVDADTLREASRGLRLRGEAAPPSAPLVGERDAWLRRQRRPFHRHAGIYLIVNLGLVMLGMLVSPILWPFLIPALAWGIGLAIHGLHALTTNEDDWAAESEEMRWWTEKQRRRHEVALARAMEKGGRAALPSSPGGRKRIEAPAAPAGGKLRVADTGGERAAEEEALAAEPEVKRRVR
jgi:eukaryotic-like serine/threonine-protein kinase